jgi:hypothetical protein
MSLVNEYRSIIRQKIGLPEEDVGSAIDGELDAGSINNIDSQTLDSVLQLLNREIAKREAVGESDIDPEGMEEPMADDTQADMSLEDTSKIEEIADDIYFEMLNRFKESISSCSDTTRKGMYRKVYEHLYKQRSKFIQEMITCDAPSGAPANPVK